MKKENTRDQLVSAIEKISVRKGDVNVPLGQAVRYIVDFIKTLKPAERIYELEDEIHNLIRRKNRL